MKNMLKFRLSTLLTATAVCAIFCYYFLLPLSPNVAFSPPEMNFCEDSKGVGYPNVFLTLKNNGRSAIWYQGSPGIVTDFSIEGDVSKGEQNFQSLDSRNKDWICLAPNETTILGIPTYMLFDTAKLRVDFRDWRHQAATCESQEFDFSSVPRKGLPGKGVKEPTVFIPQPK